jgi:hypothetical protein
MVGHGTIEYSANGKTLILPIESMTLVDHEFHFVAAGNAKPKILRALHDSPDVTLTVVASDGTRVFCNVIANEGMWLPAIEGRANHVQVYQNVRIY